MQEGDGESIIVSIYIGRVGSIPNAAKDSKAKDFLRKQGAKGIDNFLWQME